jgi:hypothetical protein
MPERTINGYRVEWTDFVRPDGDQRYTVSEVDALIGKPLACHVQVDVRECDRRGKDPVRVARDLGAFHIEAARSGEEPAKRGGRDDA